MYVMLAPAKLKSGVDEATMLAASDQFEKNFVKKQPGIVRRHLLRDGNGNYADLVFFESKDAADNVVQAELASPECALFFSLMEMDESAPDMGVLAYEQIKAYD
jgi:hypothetical protein